MSEKTKTPGRKRAGKVISLVNNIDIFLDRADELSLMGDHLAALRLLRRAERIEPDSSEVRLMIADTLMDMNCFVEAMDYLAPMLCLTDRSFKRAVFRLAHCLYGRSEYKAAIDMFKLALIETREELETPVDDLSIDEYANAYECIDLCEGYLTEDEAKERMLRDADEIVLDRFLEEAGKFSEKGEFERAAELLEQAQICLPNSVEIKTDLMLDYYCLKEYEKGREVYETIPEEARGNISVCCCGAMLFHSLGVKEKEDECAKLILAAGTDDVSELVRAFTVMTELERFEDAFEFAKRLYDIDPFNRHFIHFYANAAYNCGRETLAKRCYERCLVIEPYDSVAAYYKKLCEETIEDGESRRIQIDYSVPPSEFARRMQRTGELAKLPEDERKAHFDEIMMLANWSMNDRSCVFGDLYLLMLSRLDKKLCENLARRLLVEPDCTENMRKLAAERLNSVCADKKFLVYGDGSISVAMFGERMPEFDKWPESYKRITELVRDDLEKHKPELVRSGLEFCTVFTFHNYKERPRLPYGQVEADAAAIVFFVLTNAASGEEVDMLAFAAEHGITVRRLENALDRFMEIILKAAANGNPFEDKKDE